MEDFVGPSAMRPFLPATRSSRCPLSAQVWEDQRITFERLYSTEGKGLREVMEIMELEYGFRATYV